MPDSVRRGRAPGAATAPPPTVLLVDDREANLIALEAVLEPLPVRLIKATSGRDALRVLLQEECALVLLDVQMPDLDGFETAALIRQRERTRYTPIIFITAIHREEAHILRGYANGAVDYLLKPVEPDILLRKVRIFTEQYDRQRQDAARAAEQRDQLQLREQAALREAEVQRERLRALVMQAPAAIALLRGPDLVFELANPRYEELVGRKGLVGKAGRVALPELAAQGIWDRIEKVYATGESFVGKEFAAQLERAPGGRLDQGFFNFVAQATRGADGKVEGVLIHAVEVTEQVLALRNLEAMAESIPQLAWIADPTGWIYWYNRRWYEYTGTTPDEMKGWGWSKVHHPDHIDSVIARWKKSLASGQQWEDTFPLCGKDGRFRWFLSRASPIRDSAGKVTHWFGTNTDVTAQHEAERTLHEVNQRKTDFIGILSHELRNPLAPIRTALDVLDRVEPDSEQAQRARKVVGRQVDHLARLVDDLLDVTRISHGKIELQRSLVDLAALAARASEDQRTVLAAAEVELRVDVPGEPVWVDADPTRVEQIIGNLLQNAAKFTPSGGRVEVSVGSGARGAEIRVRDTGVGLEPAVLEQLFVPFTQAPLGIARTQGGLGLGLSLVKGLAELHGGSVTASSEGAGKGTEFVVRLPRASAGAQADAARPTRAGPLPRRVLVIEDNEDAAEMLADVLQLSGHEVRVAYDGASGLAAAREMKPDIVFCDLGLPGMDGYAVARGIREDPVLAPTLLVAVSGYSQRQDRERTAEAGFDSHLAKPASIEEVEALIDLLPASRSA